MCAIKYGVIKTPSYIWYTHQQICHSDLDVKTNKNTPLGFGTEK